MRNIQTMALAGISVQLRNNWGCELTLNKGRVKENQLIQNPFEVDFSTWFNLHPDWDANYGFVYITEIYNYQRSYIGEYDWLGGSIYWRAHTMLTIGSSFNVNVEQNPHNEVEDVILGLRPYCSVTPINGLNLRVYVDNVYRKSLDRNIQIIGGFLLSYNFLPKSWVYLAINEVQRLNNFGFLETTDRAAVCKIKYLDYF